MADMPVIDHSAVYSDVCIQAAKSLKDMGARLSQNHIQASYFGQCQLAHARNVAAGQILPAQLLARLAPLHQAKELS